MGIISEGLTLIRVLVNLPHEIKAKVLAGIVIPSVVIFVWFLQHASGTALASDTQGISIVEFVNLSNHPLNGDDQGTLFILDSSAESVSIPFISKPTDVWTSLSNNEISANKPQLSILENTIRVDMPLLGVKSSVFLWTKGEVNGAIGLPGKIVEKEHILHSIGQNSSIAHWAFMVVVFCFGISFSSVSFEHYQMSQKRGAHY